MKAIFYLPLSLSLLISIAGVSLASDPLPKLPKTSRVDFNRFSQLSLEASQVRVNRMVTWEEFQKIAKKPGTILLDTRSREAFEQVHLKGSVHLNFSDFTEEKLAKVIPEKTTTILIYCNNNFAGSPVSMMLKMAPASLNVHTQASLRAYGYENIFELGPYLDVNKTILPFAGTEVE